MPRVKPIKRKQETISIEEAEQYGMEDTHLLDNMSYPKGVFYLYDAMDYLKDNVAASMYRNLVTKISDKDVNGNSIIGYGRDQIKKEMGWSRETVAKARKTLFEYGLLTDVKRLKLHKGFKNPNFTGITNPFKINWDHILTILKAKNKDCKHIQKIEDWYGLKNRPYYTAQKIGRSSLLLRNKHTYLSHGQENLPIGISKEEKSVSHRKGNKSAYKTVSDIPKPIQIQIKKLRRLLNQEMPNSYPSKTVDKSDLIKQANAIRICISQDKLNWDKVLKPALTWAMEQEFWIQNLRSYSTLRNKWKNGDTKIKNLIVQWERQNKPSDKQRITSFNVSKYYKDFEKKEFERLAKVVGADNGSLQLFHQGVQQLKTYWDSIPSVGYKDDIGNNVFFYDFWEFVEDYIGFLDKTCDGGFGLVLLNPAYPKGNFFKRYINKHIPDTRASYYRMGVTSDGVFDYIDHD